MKTNLEEVANGIQAKYLKNVISTGKEIYVDDQRTIYKNIVESILMNDYYLPIRKEIRNLFDEEQATTIFKIIASKHDEIIEQLMTDWQLEKELSEI